MRRAQSVQGRADAEEARSADVVARPRSLGFFPTAACVISVGWIAAPCIKTAIGSELADTNIHFASAVAARQPEVLQQEIMLATAEAASRDKPISPIALRQMQRLLDGAPLASEPLAIEGALAFKQGQMVRAEQLLIEARRRNPRSAGVRYLLAELWLLQGKTEAALQEIILLTDLAPEMAGSVTTLLSNYAKTPGAVPVLRNALRKRPVIRDAMLSKLAEDPRSATLVLMLAQNMSRRGPLADWQEKLLSSLLKAGEINTAARLWGQFTGRRTDILSSFNDTSPSSPFTWKLAESGDASAEPGATGLQVHFYGRSDTNIASRVLVLPPGSYRLQFRLSQLPRPSNSLEWVIACLPQGETVAELPFKNMRSPTGSLDFKIGDRCPGQEFRLKGLAQTYPEEVSVEISGLALRSPQ